MRISDLENFDQAVSDYSVTQSHLILNYVDNDETIAPTTYKITLNNLGKALSKDSKLLYYNSNNKALLSYVKNPAEPQEGQDPPPPYVTETVGYYLNSTDKDVVAGAVTNIAYDATNKKITQTKYGTTTTDVVSVSTLKTDLQLAKGDVGLGNVDNKSSATIRSELTSSNVTTALGYTPLDSSLKGANNGVAELNASGKVPAEQLPSYVDDVIEGYLYDGAFYNEAAHTTAITGESGKIYVDLSSGARSVYRWSGSAFAEIPIGLALGTTSDTAYRGDYGAAAYAHGVTNKGVEVCNSVEDETTHEITKSPKLVKVQTNAEGHVTAATAVSAADIIGLDNIIATSSNLGLVKPQSMGIAVNSVNGEIYITKASTNELKAGTNAYSPVVSANEHEATFYGLAKAANDTTQYLSSNAVGNYTDAAKVAIQKMLGIYEAPWELINEEAFTNAETEDKIVTLDSNNEAFELTDIMLLVELPMVDDADVMSSTGNYGQVWFYYDTDDRIILEGSAMARNVGDAAKGIWYQVEYKNNLVKGSCTTPTSNTNKSSISLRFLEHKRIDADQAMGIILVNDFAINKIVIRAVTGNCYYKLYGRRKWTT